MIQAFAVMKRLPPGDPAFDLLSCADRPNGETLNLGQLGPDRTSSTSLILYALGVGAALFEQRHSLSKIRSNPAQPSSLQAPDHVFYTSSLSRNLRRDPQVLGVELPQPISAVTTPPPGWPSCKSLRKS